MGVTVPVIGSSSWGAPLNAALEDLADSGIAANDAGFQAWNYPVFQASGGLAQTSGTVVMARLPAFAQAKTVSSVWFALATTAVTPTAGQCFAALYDSAGVRLGVSADISGQLGVTGAIGFSLTAPVAVGLGVATYAALLQNAGTPAQLMACAGVNASVANGGLTAATALFTTGPAAQTSMPANVTMASRTTSQNAVWAGVK